MTTSAWGGSWGESPNSAWNDSWGFEGFTPAVVVTPTILPSGASYLAWWEREWARIRRERAERKKRKKLPPKKRELIEELDEVTLELRERLEEHDTTHAYAQQMRREVLEAAALLNEAYTAKVSAQRLRTEIVRMEEYLREMDDEETIILALH